MMGIICFSTAGACVDSFAQQPDQPSTTESNARNLVVVAARLYDLKQYDQAIEAATNAAKLLPADHRPWFIIGLCNYSQWKMKSASEAFARSAEINPRLKQTWFLKASADRMRNAREESIAASKKAIELDPNYAEAYEMLGQALAIGSKEYPAAIDAYRSALRLKPDMAKASRELGMLLSVTGNKKEAEEVYRKAMDRDPQRMACRFALGRLLVEQGKLAEARALWNERKFDEKDTFPLFITVLERAEKKKAAADKLAATPDDADALVEMGFVEMDGETWVSDGRQKLAIAYFERALAKRPDLARAQYGISKAYIEIASIEKAANADVDRELAKLRQMDPKLADELIQYRKTYSSGLTTGPAIKINQ